MPPTPPSATIFESEAQAPITPRQCSDDGDTLRVHTEAFRHPSQLVRRRDCGASSSASSATKRTPPLLEWLAFPAQKLLRTMKLVYTTVEIELFFWCRARMCGPPPTSGGDASFNTPMTQARSTTAHNHI